MRIPYACSLLLLAGLPGRAAAQDESVVNAIAQVLAAEDARRFDPHLVDAARNPDPIVRRHAALAAGRIRDPAATPILLELLDDPAASVRKEAAFALGLLADPSAFDRLRDLILQAHLEQQGAIEAEAIAALTKIGGTAAVEFVSQLLTRWAGRAPSQAEAPSVVVRALREAWRLGDSAPVGAVLEYGEAASTGARLGAIYSLARLRRPEAATLFMRAVDDPVALIRSFAVRALTAEFADSAGLERSGTARWITPLVEDPDPGVRINALRSLGTYADPTFTAIAAGALGDVDANVRVQALATLGRLGGPEAAEILERHLAQGTAEMQRQSLLGLARIARDRGLVHCATWITSNDWAQRAAGAAGLGVIGGDTAVAWLDELTRDPDGRVAARALTALVAVDSSRALAASRRLAGHVDPVVRALALQQIARDPRREDVSLLVHAYELAQTDDIPDARIAAVRALGAVAERGFSERTAVEDQFLRRYVRQPDYLVRRAAQEYFPAAAAAWGPETPIESGRGIDDYRDVARRLVWPAETTGSNPRLVIETAGGPISVELFAADAPLTVDALLRLADRHYFDGGTWHRVVPNFVAQDGDPRGDGWGGPGFTLRDEVSSRPYTRGTVGLALGGPDTGGSQFFIVLSPQPHLEGTYPVLGHVESGMELLERTTQGDRIRTIRRR